MYVVAYIYVYVYICAGTPGSTAPVSIQLCPFIIIVRLIDALLVFLVVYIYAYVYICAGTPGSTVHQSQYNPVLISFLLIDALLVFYVCTQCKLY